MASVSSVCKVLGKKAVDVVHRMLSDEIIGLEEFIEGREIDGDELRRSVHHLAGIDRDEGLLLMRNRAALLIREGRRIHFLALDGFSDIGVPILDHVPGGEIDTIGSPPLLFSITFKWVSAYVPPAGRVLRGMQAYSWMDSSTVYVRAFGRSLECIFDAADHDHITGISSLKLRSIGPCE